MAGRRTGNPVPRQFEDAHYDSDVLGVFSTFPLERLSVHALCLLEISHFQSGDGQSIVGPFSRHSPGTSLKGAFFR